MKNAWKHNIVLLIMTVLEKVFVLDTVFPLNIKCIFNISDLRLTHMYGSHFSHWKHYMGESGWQELPGVFAME